MSAMGKIGTDAQVTVPALGVFRSSDARGFIASAFERPGPGVPRLIEGGIEAALTAVRRERPPLIVYDLSQSNDPVGEVASLVSHAGRGTPLLCFGPTIELALFRALLASGATDYLDRANGPVPLADAVARARRKRSQRTVTTAQKAARIVAFVGARGGIGTTSCALSLASAFAETQSTIVVDLDLMFGTAAFALDLDPGTGLRDGLAAPGRIDAQFIDGSIVRVRDRFAVLAAEDACDDGFTADAAAVAVLLDELKTSYEVVVLDLPRVVTPVTTACLSAAADVVLVTDATLGSLRDAIRWRTFIAANSHAALHVVQNGARAGFGLPRASFEKTLQMPLAAVLPDDPKAARAAADTGQTFAAALPGGAYAGQLRAFAGTLGVAEAEAAPGLLARLARLVSGSSNDAA